MTQRKSKSAHQSANVEIEKSRTIAAAESGSGRYAYEGLDRTIHEKARLGILTSLAANPSGLLFNDLKDLCSLTDGNLSRHLQTLQDAGLVEVWKGVQFRRPQTLLRLTDAGRQRLLTYITELERVVADAAAATRDEAQSTSRGTLGVAPGFVPG